MGYAISLPGFLATESAELRQGDPYALTYRCSLREDELLQCRRRITRDPRSWQLEENHDEHAQRGAAEDALESTQDGRRHGDLEAARLVILQQTEVSARVP